MQDIKVYEEGAEVLIKAEVAHRILHKDGVRYVLSDPKSGKEYHYFYDPSEVYPVPAGSRSETPGSATTKKAATKK